MAAEDITVDALIDHSYDGVPRPAGTRYALVGDAEAQRSHLDFLTRAGYARPAAAGSSASSSPPPAPPDPPKHARRK